MHKWMKKKINYFTGHKIDFIQFSIYSIEFVLNDEFSLKVAKQKRTFLSKENCIHANPIFPFKSKKKEKKL